MAKRRVNDDGSIYYSKAERCWFAQLPPDARGKRPKRRAKTQEEAIRKLTVMRDMRGQGGDPSAKRLRVNDLLDLWLTQIVKVSVKESTHESYEQIAKLYIRPTLGTRWLDTVEPLDIQQWVNDLRRQYSSNVVRNAHARLHGAFDAAVTWRKLLYNPTNRVTLPRPAKATLKAPQTAAMQRWLTATEDHRLGTLYLMAAVLGPRVGELAGLPWRTYDRTAETITIDQQITEVRGTRSFTTPKNDEARTLPVPPGLAKRLVAQWELLQRERMSEDWKEHGLIFPSELGTPLFESNINRHLRDGLQRLGLPHWSMHAFRHYTATRLGELGVSDHIIGGILGHSPGRNVTRRYAYPTLDAMRQALTRLEDDILRRAA